MQSRNEADKYIIKNDVTIVAPRSHRLMTPFVLKEQNDWFEDEIKFLRHYIRDGMKILDIGANYGVYALTMAKLIGPSGRLWAFEPTASTASYLAEGIKANKFKNIKLLQYVVQMSKHSLPHLRIIETLKKRVKVSLLTTIKTLPFTSMSHSISHTFQKIKSGHL